ncbi:hypothetical protein [Mycolicibacterium septicum]|uniref:hypothetical protein n=1 Tax=Mycolicibacterium septicum TaxID=98668 RepID=UPI001AF48AE4|nr:hypothetical protein [Mycolicibacterium septicum]QRY53383.1 hypothetical protein JVX95_08720 [Mycolicibacterium septicum]
MPVNAIENVFTALAGAPLLDGAACRGQAPGWDGADPADPATAVAIGACRQCPALAPCRQWVTSLSPSRRPSGVVAGRIYRRAATGGAVTTPQIAPGRTEPTTKENHLP